MINSMVRRILHGKKVPTKDFKHFKSEFKSKVLGQRQLVDLATNEVIHTTLIEVNADSDKNWKKLWISELIHATKLLTSQRTNLVYFLIGSASKDNVIIGTYREIAKDAKVSLQTVNITMNILLEGNFITRLKQGRYLINPDIIFQGSGSKRRAITFIYNSFNGKKRPRKVVELSKNQVSA